MGNLCCTVSDHNRGLPIQASKIARNASDKNLLDVSSYSEEAGLAIDENRQQQYN